MNAIMTIYPYKYNGVWVFDDENFGLMREAFVSGMTEIIDAIVDKELKTNCDDGFVLIFAGTPFPGYQAKLTRIREDFGGNWYKWKDTGMEGWLCPALFHYFDTAPDNIYVQVKLN